MISLRTSLKTAQQKKARPLLSETRSRFGEVHQRLREAEGRRESLR
jgi:hypothetical protein